MLVLTRKLDEKIIIRVGDEKIEIMLVEVRGERVRIGITAPRGFPVHREEIDRMLYEDKQ